MGHYINLVGHVYGRLTVLKDVGRSNGSVLWKCRCACGVTLSVPSNSLRTQNTQSCGCLMVGTPKHGHCPNTGVSSTYKSWSNMIQRCTNPHQRYYFRYGGAGVRVCKRWRTFKNFYLDMGKRPQGTTLGRYLDSGDYKKSNCAWMTPAEQGQEQRKHNRLVSK